MKKILVLIVSYNAAPFITSVFDRIPSTLFTSQEHRTDVLLLDDTSPDDTVEVAQRYAAAHPEFPITIIKNPQNLGYGGNQKKGYRYAIDHEYDAVVLLHGDGQYAPELLPQFIAPFLNEPCADVVLGSRMVHKKEALHGGMPLHKWLGNIGITAFQNALLRTSLTEFHTGYRAYNVHMLARLPFEHNANWFDFDTDILIQCIDNNAALHEFAIPTFYGDETSHVKVVKYTFAVLWSTLSSRLQKCGLYRHPKFIYRAQ